MNGDHQMGRMLDNYRRYLLAADTSIVNTWSAAFDQKCMRTASMAQGFLLQTTDSLWLLDPDEIDLSRTSRVRPMHWKSEDQPQLTLWPNPAREEIYLNIPKGLELTDVVVNLYGPLGNLLLQSPTTLSQIHRLNLEDLAPGVYVVEIQWKGMPALKEKFTKL